MCLYWNCRCRLTVNGLYCTIDGLGKIGRDEDARVLALALAKRWKDEKYSKLKDDLANAETNR